MLKALGFEGFARRVNLNVGFHGLMKHTEWKTDKARVNSRSLK